MELSHAHESVALEVVRVSPEDEARASPQLPPSPRHSIPTQAPTVRPRFGLGRGEVVARTETWIDRFEENRATDARLNLMIKVCRATNPPPGQKMLFLG